MSPEAFSEPDVEWVDGYDVHPSKATRTPAKIMFGPVYKIVEGERVLLRRGTVLRD